MIASAANGFMNTSPADCSGTPFNFQPEYSSAEAAEHHAVGPGPYNINTQFEIGHFEPCTEVTEPSKFAFGLGFRHVLRTAMARTRPTRRRPSLEPTTRPATVRGHTRRDRAAKPGDGLRRVLRRGRRPRLRRHAISGRLADVGQPGTFPGAFAQRSPPARTDVSADPVRHRPIGERAELQPQDRRRLHGAAAGPRRLLSVLGSGARSRARLHVAVRQRTDGRELRWQRAVGVRDPELNRRLHRPNHAQSAQLQALTIPGHGHADR